MSIFFSNTAGKWMCSFNVGTNARIRQNQHLIQGGGAMGGAAFTWFLSESSQRPERSHSRYCTSKQMAAKAIVQPSAVKSVQQILLTLRHKETT